MTEQIDDTLDTFEPREPSLEELQNRYQSDLVSLHRLAREACDQILSFEPDLVMVLAHGGGGALWAVQVLWPEITDRPFPPLLVTNLGREKLEAYHTARADTPFAARMPFVPNFTGNHETGHFLAWVSRQTAWQDALRCQVLTAANDHRPGQEPRRILVLDDTTWLGATFRLALGLLRDTFPGCEARMVAGNLLDWRDTFAHLWLYEHRQKLDREQREKMFKLAYKIALGTEDDPESELGWRPITRESAVMGDLTRFLPAEAWLEYLKWVKESICNGVLNLHRQGGEAVEKAGRRIDTPALRAEELILKQVWLQGSITRREAARLLGVSPPEAGAILSGLVSEYELLLQSRGRGATYILTPDATTPDEQFPNPLVDCYWVERDRLMVGEMTDISYRYRGGRQITWLLSQGIRCFINLGPLYGNESGEQDFRQVVERRARRFGVEATFFQFSLPLNQPPDIGQAEEALEAISRAHQAGQPVYLQARFIQVAEAIAGCYLVSRGYGAAQAFEELTRLRKDTRYPWQRMDARPRLKRLVRRFEKKHT